MYRKLLTAAAAAATLAGATFATASTAQAGYGYGHGYHGHRYGYVKIYRPVYCHKFVKYTYHGPVWVKSCH